MFTRNTIIFVMMLSLIFMAGCSDDSLNKKGENQSSHASENDQSNDVEQDEVNELDAKRQAEPRQIPSAYPFPIPDGWSETTGANVFKAEETEKGIEWWAEFHFDHDPKDEGEKYEGLLEELGFSIHIGTSEGGGIAKSFRANGHIEGVMYMGLLTFSDANPDGFGDGVPVPATVHMVFQEAVK